MATDVNLAAVVDTTRKFQELLKETGYYTGEVNGVWDAPTQNALAQWQHSMGIGESGAVDQATISKVHDISTLATGGQEDPVRKQVRDLYGPAMGAYLDHPELGPIIRQAAQEGWDAQRLQGRIQQTDWWRSTSDSARQWDEHNLSNPADANAKRATKLAYVRDVAGQVGVNLNDAVARQITEDSLRLGLSNPEVSSLVTSFAVYDPKQPNGGGEIAANVDQLRKVARSFYLTPDDAELFDKAKRIASGQLTLDGATSTYREQAKLNHPALASTIDAGGTVEDYFAETKRRVASALEVDPSTIDLMNDKRFWPIMGFVDGKGRRRPMTWGEAIQYVNKMPEADKTERLNQKAAELGQVFRQTFSGVN